MKHRSRLHLLWLWMSVLVLIAGGCSVKKNTRWTRFYHSFTTRYNVFYNGSVAFRDGVDAVMKGNKDYYSDIIPLDPLSNKNTVGQGSSNFDRAIEKGEKSVKLHSIRKKPKKKAGRQSAKKKLWYSQKEFNPFLYRAWLMIGQSQYWKGEYLEAAATFSYIARLYENNPKVLPYARIWLARCYSQLDWFYDAENALTLTRTEGYQKRHERDFNYVQANYLLRQERYEEAIPVLQQVIKKEKNKTQRQRELFLLGQLYQHLGRDKEAYDTYGRLIRKSPPYEMEFNARIRQTEVLSGSTKKMERKLQRMARSQKNKDYLDQIYYAIGNIYLSRQDTLKAMEQYRLAAEKSTRGGKEKAVALLTLAQLCWERFEYTEAQQCYQDALGLIDKEYPGFEELSARSAVLDELVGYAEAVQLQDSLQHLATLPETEQLAIIDKIIEDLIKKEEEERKKQEEAELLAQHEADQAANAPTLTQQQTIAPTVNTGGSTSWYFYNSQTVQQGKTAFQNLWGSRKLEDNWRRRNKTTVATSDYEEIDYAAEDSIAQAQAMLADSLMNDTLAQAKLRSDSLENDPHQREYYLKQIPVTEEQLAESNRILSDGLFNMGLIYKDKLEDESLATQVWDRLIREFPDFERLDETYYNMYLMYLRYGKEADAELAKARLLEQFPESKYALTVGDPDFLDNALHGVQREDSLYASSYDAFKDGRFDEVIRNDEYAAKKYAMGKHRAKFLFLHAMASLKTGDRQDFMAKLKEVTQNYPDNEITALAADIMKGLEEGRLLSADSDFGSIWSLRARELAGDTTLVDTLSNAFQPGKDEPYVFLLAYPEGQVDEDRMLYEMARFNFASFIVKDFDLSFSELGAVRMMKIEPFNSFDEVRYYMYLLYKDGDMVAKLSGLRPVIISQHNYDLLMKYYSFDDYARFYEENFGELPTLEDTLEVPEGGDTLDEPLQNLPELPEGEEYEPEDEIIEEDVFID
ncbi:MAG: tetratricopeptide repeat protein [Bacteroidaceae bacterium]|jgi:tetratricopeptide (TPR) repeat protein